MSEFNSGQEAANSKAPQRKKDGDAEKTVAPGKGEITYHGTWQEVAEKAGVAGTPGKDGTLEELLRNPVLPPTQDRDTRQNIIKPITSEGILVDKEGKPIHRLEDVLNAKTAGEALHNLASRDFSTDKPVQKEPSESNLPHSEANGNDTDGNPTS